MGGDHLYGCYDREVARSRRELSGFISNLLNKVETSIDLATFL